MLILSSSKIKKIHELLSDYEKQLTEICGVAVMLSMVCVDKKQPTLDEIDQIIDRTKKIVANQFSISVKEMKSNNNSRPLPDARKVFYKLIKQQVPIISLKHLALAMNRTNHTTVIHALEKFDDLITTDSLFAQAYHNSLSQLKNF